MCRVIGLFKVVIIVAVASMASGCGKWAYKSDLSEPLKSSIETAAGKPEAEDDSTLCIQDKITKLFDKSRQHLSGGWKSIENLGQMYYVLHNIYKEGLNPEDYHLSAIDKLTDKIILSDTASITDISNLEFLLADSFRLLSQRLAAGKTDAETIDPEWKASRRVVSIDWQTFIDSSLLNNRIIENLQKLTPGHREYSNLKKALLQYLLIEKDGGWGMFTTDLPKLEKGMCHPDIVLLRNRLAFAQGYFENGPEDSNLFDQVLYEQVILFQERNGLTADGVVGKSTVEAMNITVEARIASIEANLERWRWLSDDLGNRYITVNIANFELQVIENGDIIFSSKVIVGRSPRKTPVFSSVMTYMVLNPDWTVPPTILNADIIPSVIKNPDYLAEKNLKILRIDGTEVDPKSIDWTKIVTDGFPYRIHQEPGPENALGKVKFMFPNKYSVYIHDTPNHRLFGSTDRSFSSGCIRVNKPLDLVACLMKDYPEWTTAQIKTFIDQGKERTVKLLNPIEVHIVYLTAWASNDGTVSFRKDVYGRDQPLIAALKPVNTKTDQ